MARDTSACAHRTSRRARQQRTPVLGTLTTRLSPPAKTCATSWTPARPRMKLFGQKRAPRGRAALPFATGMRHMAACCGMPRPDAGDRVGRPRTFTPHVPRSVVRRSPVRVASPATRPLQRNGQRKSNVNVRCNPESDPHRYAQTAKRYTDTVPVDLPVSYRISIQYSRV